MSFASFPSSGMCQMNSFDMLPSNGMNQTNSFAFILSWGMCQMNSFASFLSWGMCQMNSFASFPRRGMRQTNSFASFPRRGMRQMNSFASLFCWVTCQMDSFASIWNSEKWKKLPFVYIYRYKRALYKKMPIYLVCPTPYMYSLVLKTCLPFFRLNELLCKGKLSLCYFYRLINNGIRLLKLFFHIRATFCPKNASIGYKKFYRWNLFESTNWLKSKTWPISFSSVSI